MTPGFAASLLLIACLYSSLTLIKGQVPVSECISSEREALIKFKRGLEDPFQHLASWDDEPNCCQWEGLTCDNNTGNVIKLDIHSPCSIDIIAYSFDLPEYGLDARDYGCWNLSGRLDPALAQLKHIHYIDLSLNTFDGLAIPTFLGSLTELHHLNLSYAGFGGLVPKQLGNLSNLQVLDISSIYQESLIAMDLHWLPTMSSLKHLEMNRMDLSGVSSDWINIISAMPNLENLHAFACEIQNIDPNPQVVNFTSLRTLDLSLNNLPGASLLQWVTNLTALEFLDLSGCLNGYDGRILNTLSELPNLQELIFSRNDLNKNVSEVFSGSWRKIRRMELVVNSLYGDFPNSIGNITSLEELVIWGNKITGRLTEKNMHHLKYLSLSDNSIEGIQVGNTTSLEHIELASNGVILLQSDIRNLMHLKYLDVSTNKIISAIPKELGLLSSLEYLDLSGNSITGGIPREIGNLTSLKILDFSHNMIHGMIPKEIGKLANLNSLDVSYNKINGSVPREIGNLVKLEKMSLVQNELAGGLPKEIGKLINLEQLDVLENKFHGVELEWLCPLKKLWTLDLRNSKLTGPIPPCLGYMSSLWELDLSGNELNGTLPSTIGQLSNLEILVLSSNNLHGPVSEAHFQNMSKLARMRLSSNFLNFQLPQNWIPPFQLAEASLTSCHIGPAFPAWLKTQKNIQTLDMSNTSIADTIPLWFWNFTSHSIDSLNFSNNMIRGHLPNPFPSFTSYAGIDLSNNLISGLIPRFSGELGLLDISDNLVAGSIPEDFCNVTALNCIDIFLASRNKINGSIPSSFGEFETRLLDLSDNSLSGNIPWNLGKSKGLEVLDLSKNQLSGELQWPVVLLQSLKTLHLEKNILSGKLPSSLRNCTSIETLDIGENRFHGNIPRWIGHSLPALRVLRLRNNSFTGQIPSELSKLQSLHVLDLARNFLSGPIPKTLGGLRSMKLLNKTNTNLIYGDYYQERVIVSMKGQMLEYTRTLSLVASIDFSFNNLSGVIPPELTVLSELLVLDLSHNRLSGRIPNNVGHLRQLLSLDLSWNKLSGEIPPSISNLTYLSKLNLSYNQLSGRIPTGQQLQTLEDPTIYVGNNQLCGQQLPNKCPGKDLPEDPTQPINEISKGKDSSKMWFFVSMGTGYVFGFWVFCGVLTFKSSWRFACFRVFDGITDWLFVKLALIKAQLKRKLRRN